MKKVKTTKGMSYIINRDMKRKRLTDVRRFPRQIGKTTQLYKIAKEKDYMIVVGTYAHAKILNLLFDTNRFIPFSNNGVFSKLSDTKFLLEEDLTLEQEKFLIKKYNVVGGLSSNAR